MTNTRMIRLLQQFFDGNVLGPVTIKRMTGDSDEDCLEMYEAIKHLRSLPFEKIDEMDDGIKLRGVIERMKNMAEKLQFGATAVVPDGGTAGQRVAWAIKEAGRIVEVASRALAE